jgi:membrane protease YdiL (CAAX protease family)
MKLEANYRTALVGGLLIGLIPAWLVSVLVSLFPALRPEELEVVAEFMSSGFGIVQLLFFMIIVFVIPPLEELVFRGWAWKLINWKLSPYWTWIVVSLLFAAIHMEPVHIIGLLPFSFFAGWLRYKTGELGPSIVAHMANNAVACLLMVV